MKTKTAKTEKNATSNAKVESIPSDAELMQGLEAINLEAITAKVANNRGIWNKDAISAYKSDKSARRNLRAIQLKLCKALLSCIISQQSQENINAAALALKEFNAKNLSDSKNYSNISPELHKDKREILDKAYAKLQILGI